MDLTGVAVTAFENKITLWKGDDLVETLEADAIASAEADFINGPESLHFSPEDAFQLYDTFGFPSRPDRSPLP